MHRRTGGAVQAGPWLNRKGSPFRAAAQVSAANLYLCLNLVCTVLTGSFEPIGLI